MTVSTPLPVTPAAASGADARLRPMRATAQQFEAMALGELLKPMFATLDPTGGHFGGGSGEAFWKPLLVEEMGKKLSQSGGIGLADRVLQEMLRMQEKMG